MARALDDFASMLRNEAFPISLQHTALQHILGLTGSEEGLKYLIENEEFLKNVFIFAAAEGCADLCILAHKCLINISASSSVVSSLHRYKPDINEWLISGIENLSCPCIEMKCQVLSNMTRYEAACSGLANFFLATSESFSKLMFLYLSNDLNMKGKYDYLALVLGNLSFVAEGKRLFLNQDYPYLKYILLYTTYYDSEVRRLGAAMLLRNVCFEIDQHKWLLETVEMLPFLLLPLAGPEDFDDEEMEKLPVELQYLGDSQVREPNVYIRVLLLEALLKLCSTKYGRMYLRNKGTYYILRELHKWETKPPAIRACDDVVEILIRDESDLNAENLMDINIPGHLVENFENMTLTTCEVPSIVL